MSTVENFSRRSRRGVFGGLTKRWAQYRTYNQTLNELESLSEREMIDLGIKPSQLRAIAYRAAYSG